MSVTNIVVQEDSKNTLSGMVTISYIYYMRKKVSSGYKCECICQRPSTNSYCGYCYNPHVKS